METSTRFGYSQFNNIYVKGLYFSGDEMPPEGAFYICWEQVCQVHSGPH